ncbi:hypothetical protein HAX54_013461, partial [Datura stramonium]|nr:hypothetical protein [Datura stramonium]
GPESLGKELSTYESSMNHSQGLAEHRCSTGQKQNSWSKIIKNGKSMLHMRNADESLWR